MFSTPPRFLVTIDTERDNAWAKEPVPTTRNARFLPRFNDLCEQYGLVPTYLTNHEMCADPYFQAFAREKLDSGLCEVGLHLHAWDSPPMANDSLDGFGKGTYLIEYPSEQLRAKLVYLTSMLEDTFGRAITSHRAGRWALNEKYVQELLSLGIKVDCSVTPHVDWTSSIGHSLGGTDYSDFPETPYRMSALQIMQASEKGLLQVPMTIRTGLYPSVERITKILSRGSLLARSMRRFCPQVVWLRPNGRNLSALIRLLRHEELAQSHYVMFMLHSSELMPGGSPTFRTNDDIERLYNDMERLFRVGTQTWSGQSLTGYASELKLI